MVVGVNAMQVALEAPIEAPIPAATADLGLVGRILLAAVFVVGLVVGYTSGLGLFLYIPFAGVGAFLVLRRPRMSIGWMLFGIGWGFALISSRIDATLEQFQTGTVELADVAFIVLQGLGYLGAFVLLPTLVLAFPSGRLPSGAWGRAVRLVIAAEAIVFGLVVFAPQISINLVSRELAVVVRNPVAILPDLPIWAVVNPGNAPILFVILLLIAASSIGVRFRRSVGVERQQLKWLAGAGALVVFGVVFGLTTAALLPNVADSGFVWLPALAGFVAVPVSIAVAILRYRLYDINTIINRAIVYGLLTAILTGGSAAIISLGQRLFVGVVGPGSDATIVITTLIVVTAFNPIKARLQTLVDRRFKEVHSADAALAAFVLEVRRSVSPPDLYRSLQRLLDVAVGAYGSSGGTVSVIGAGRNPWSASTGEPVTEPAFVVSGPAGSRDVHIRIANTEDWRGADALEQALSAVIAETTSPPSDAAALRPSTPEAARPELRSDEVMAEDGFGDDPS
jgi:hypothetical protein